jgi:hypothetical protein
MNLNYLLKREMSSEVDHANEIFNNLVVNDLARLVSGKNQSENRIGRQALQGCQIFLNTIFQNGGKLTKLPLNYQMAITHYKWA